MKYLLMLSLLMVAVGCGPMTRDYQVALKNNTSESLQIGLAKNGPPIETRWATPEELAISNAQGGQRTWGVAVAPGKSAETRKVSGKFYNGEDAWLRIYAGVGGSDLSQLLAISRGDPNRLDIRLLPGFNSFVIRDKDGVLSAIRINPSNK